MGRRIAPRSAIINLMFCPLCCFSSSRLLGFAAALTQNRNRQPAVCGLQAIAMGGKSQFPYMVDPNTGTSMYESDDIINYLFDNYGPGASEVPWFLQGPLAILTAGLALVPSNIITLAGG
jgi:hypothetical protein